MNLGGAHRLQVPVRLTAFPGSWLNPNKNRVVVAVGSAWPHYNSACIDEIWSQIHSDSILAASGSVVKPRMLVFFKKSSIDLNWLAVFDCLAIVRLKSWNVAYDWYEAQFHSSI